MEDQIENMEAAEDTSGDAPLDEKTYGVGDYVMDKYYKAESARDSEENRWLRAYRNYRGIYGPDVQFTSKEKSDVFVKVTKTKVLAAYGQIAEVLFGGSKFPISINPTTLPEGVDESIYIETNPQFESLSKGGPEAQEAPNDRTLRPGETRDQLKARLGSFLEKELAGHEENIKIGSGGGPTEVSYSPSMIAAKKMEKKIHDQLEESKANKHLRSSAFECALFGTGIMKGPFIENKEYPKWDDEGNYDPVIKPVPKVTHVSIWDFYPDPDADSMDEAEFVVERHKMSRTQLRALKKRPHFRGNEIDVALEGGESYLKKEWETAMEDDREDPRADRFEVLEFWGTVDTDTLREYNVEIPSEHSEKDEVSINVWVCNDRVLRLVFNPFTPAILPYYAFPYEVNPYSFFGVGVAENMDDTQTLMNGFMRMAVDNAALSGNLLIEIDQDALEPGQDMSIYPGKVFKRQAGAPGQGIFGTKFPNVSNENMQMFDKARVLADESTGFPSFAHGQTGVQGVGRTASGISMLMGAANGAIRTVVKNVDDYLLMPMGQALFAFNMQFDFDKDIKGDLEVKAGGTESLMANEVRSQRLMQFLQIVSANPALAPFAKMDYIIREIAKSMDLDPDKVANDMKKAMLNAKLLQSMQAPAAGPEAPGGPQDTQGSGGATIGTGSVPTPGEQGFSGNSSGAGGGTPPGQGQGLG